MSQEVSHPSLNAVRAQGLILRNPPRNVRVHLGNAADLNEMKPRPSQLALEGEASSGKMRGEECCMWAPGLGFLPEVHLLPCLCMCKCTSVHIEACVLRLELPGREGLLVPSTLISLTLDT